MRKLMVVLTATVAALVIALSTFIVQAQEKHSAQSKADSVAEHLKIFDELDFDVYSNQKWNRFSESHADDILVTYPDGHQTKGIQQHIEELKPMFVFAPDTKITEHPIKFGSVEWTCVTGVMSGTFSQPMPIGNGKTIPPTGKRFKLTMVTIGHWKNGKMMEESLIWDNQNFMKQIGLTQ